MTAALEGGEWSAARPGRTLPPGKIWYPFYRRLRGPQGRSRLAENLVPTGIRSRTVQPVVSRCTDWATRPNLKYYVCVYIYIYIYIYIRRSGGTYISLFNNIIIILLKLYIYIYNTHTHNSLWTLLLFTQTFLFMPSSEFTFRASKESNKVVS